MSEHYDIDQKAQELFEQKKLYHPGLTLDKVKDGLYNLENFARTMVEMVMDPKNRSKFEEMDKQIELEKASKAPKPVIKYDQCSFGDYNIRYSKKLTKKLNAEPKKHLRKPEINKLEKYVFPYLDEIPKKLASTFNKIGLDFRFPYKIELITDVNKDRILVTVYEFVGEVNTIEYKDAANPTELNPGLYYLLSNDDGLNSLFFQYTYLGEPRSYFYIGFSICEADEEDILIEQEYEASLKSKRKSKPKPTKNNNKKSL